MKKEYFCKIEKSGITKTESLNDAKQLFIEQILPEEVEATEKDIVIKDYKEKVAKRKSFWGKLWE